MRTACLVVALLLLVGAGAGTALAAKKKPPPSAADAEKLAKAKEHFEKGKRLGEVGRYEESIAEFEKAYFLQPIPEILLNIALSYRYLKQWDKAIEIYDRYLKLKPDAKSRKEVEKILKELHKEKEAAEAVATAPTPSTKAKLSIKSEPTGAAVYRGGVALGTTPLVVETEPGDFVLHFALAGHVPKDMVGKATAGSITEVSVSLAKVLTAEPPTSDASPMLSVVTRIAGISVYVDGEFVDHTPFDKLVPVTPGAHRITVEGPGLHAAPKDVLARPGALVKEKFVVVPVNRRAMNLFEFRREKFLASGLTIDGYLEKRRGVGFLSWGIPLVVIGASLLAVISAGGREATATGLVLGLPPIAVGAGLIVGGALKLQKSKTMTWDRPKADRPDGGLADYGTIPGLSGPPGTKPERTRDESEIDTAPPEDPKKPPKAPAKDWVDDDDDGDSDGS